LGRIRQLGPAISKGFLYDSFSLAEAKLFKQLKHASNDEGIAISLVDWEISGRQQHQFQ
jgi:hypothetical protein